MLNIEQVLAFTTAVETGSFSAAARHLGKSQSSVSIAINNLELDLGVTLFDRSTKYPTMTDQGQRLYEQAKVLLRQVERIQSYANSSGDNIEDTVKIGIDPLIPLSLIDSALEKMAQVFPHTKVELSKLHGSTLCNAIKNEQIDLGLYFTSEAIPEGLDFSIVSNVEWVCICSPDSKFADMESVDNETLISERQIMCTSMVDNLILRNTNKISQDIWQASDQDDMARLVEQGLGWALIPKSIALEKQELGTLVSFIPQSLHAKSFIPAELIWKVNTQQGPVVRFIIDAVTKNL